MSTSTLSALTACYRASAIAAWAISIFLFVFGVVQDAPLHYYAASNLAMMIAMTFSWLAVFDQAVSSIARRESAISREVLAGAVAEALADELTVRGLVVSEQAPYDDDRVTAIR